MELNYKLMTERHLENYQVFGNQITYFWKLVSQRRNKKEIKISLN